MATSVSCRSDSKSDHNEGGTNIKSDVVSMESSGSSTDVTHTALVGGPVLSLINKRLGNHAKKLNLTYQAEEILAQGKPLNEEQAQLLQSKPVASALIDELEKLKNPLASAASQEISLALQCHAIPGKNGTCQDQDQDEASEEKEFKSHNKLPIDSRSDHNEGSPKIKSDVLVSIDSGGFSSDVTDTTLVGGPVLSLINKRLRNHRKKLNRILRMEEFLAQGKPLNKEQSQLLQSKSAISAVIDELEKLKKPLASAASEGISLAFQCHAISAENATCQDQEKASEEKEFKAQKELPIDPKSDHDGGTKDVMGTEHGGPSQVDKQNEGIALPLRTELKQKDRKWKVRCKKYVEENAKLLAEKRALLIEFESLNLSALLHGIKGALFERWPKFDCTSNVEQNEEDQEEENSLIDQQNEEFSLSLRDAEILGISDDEKMEEVDWERLCREMRFANMWVKEQLSVYEAELALAKKLAVEFPDFIEGKPAADPRDVWTWTS